MSKTKDQPKPDSFSFSLWRDNKLDQEYQMTIGEFRTQFLEFAKNLELAYMEYYGTQGALQKFIGNKEHLNSVVGSEMYPILFDAMKEDFWNIHKEKGGK